MSAREAYHWQRRNGRWCTGPLYAARWAAWWRLGWRRLYPGIGL